MNRAITTYAAVIQLVAILLLQYYPMAAHLGRNQALPHCSGDHVQCGCAPERVASGTCCCYSKKPACCDRDNHQGGERVTRKDGNPSSPYLSAAPCGSTAKFVTTSLEKIKFLRPQHPAFVSVEASVSFTASLQELFSGRFGDPPDPPPKLALFS